uniref:MARVEL domain-containing protein n=1 Tax=Strongyloides stercoralis TaxID=6248 RepID=A0A0K0E2A6_STRER
MEKTSTGSEVDKKPLSKENKQEENSSKHEEWTSVADTLKKKDTPQLQENTNQEKSQKQLGGIYGYTPFVRPPTTNATFNPNTLPDTIYGVRPGSAIPRPQIGNKISTNGVISRPSSALDNIYSGSMQRPESRTGSEYGMPIIGSRYQSYTTLPRPEQLDNEQINNYGPYSIYGTSQQAYGAASRGRQIPVEGVYGYGGRNIMKGAPISRPASALSNIMIPNGFGKPAYLNPAFSVSNMYMGQPAATTIPSKTGPIMLSTENVGYKKKGTLINNSGLSVCSSMQVISGLCFIGIGIARIILNAKWAFGIEVAFGFLSILTGLLGVIGLRNKNYSCSVASFIISNANIYFVIIPFLIGLIPLLPFHIRSDTFVVLIGNDEPIEVDIALTVLCIIQFFLSLTMTIFGCRSWGITMDHVEHLRLRDVMREVYSGNINKQ